MCNENVNKIILIKNKKIKKETIKNNPEYIKKNDMCHAI